MAGVEVAAEGEAARRATSSALRPPSRSPRAAHRCLSCCTDRRPSCSGVSAAVSSAAAPASATRPAAGGAHGAWSAASIDCAFECASEGERLAKWMDGSVLTCAAIQMSQACRRC